MNSTKICSKCHETKPLDEFHKDNHAKDSKHPHCKKCRSKQTKKYNRDHREERKEKQRIWYENGGRQKGGHLSMYENKLCASYLGIVIGERLIRHLFNDVQVMPFGFSGYDFICNKGKKVDVKTACITLADEDKYPRWAFAINRNTAADFFILVAFDNLTDLNPLHIWMIPGQEINNQTKASISLSIVHKWDQWKRDINDAQLCCSEMKKGDV